MARVHGELTLLAFLALATPTGAVRAQTNTLAARDSLSRTILALDSALFTAYNHCDLPRLAALVAEDLEFYDDRDGVSRSRDTLIAQVKRFVCGKTRRDLVPRSISVRALPGYGALQTGRHRFCDPLTFRRCTDKQSMTADFLHIWHDSAGVWQLARVVSYGHPEPAVPSKSPGPLEKKGEPGAGDRSKESP